MNTAKDPVCGMDVDPEQAAGKSEYQGQTYYFCGEGCRAKFEADPERYVDVAGRTAAPLQHAGHRH